MNKQTKSNGSGAKKRKPRKIQKKQISKGLLVCMAFVAVVIAAFVMFTNTNTISFYNAKGERITTFMVEIADTDIKREKGLMFVEELAKNRGMLFIYDDEQIVSMWMKNTYIPLDMVFVDANNTVQCIRKRTTPKSLIPQICMIPVQYVLEINGGLADKLGIKVGNKVEIRK